MQLCLFKDLVWVWSWTTAGLDIHLFSKRPLWVLRAEVQLEIMDKHYFFSFSATPGLPFLPVNGTGVTTPLPSMNSSIRCSKPSFYFHLFHSPSLWSSALQYSPAVTARQFPTITRHQAECFKGNNILSPSRTWQQQSLQHITQINQWSSQKKKAIKRTGWSYIPVLPYKNCKFWKASN